MTQEQAKASKTFLEAIGYSEVTAQVYTVAGVVQQGETGNALWCVHVDDAGFRCVDMLGIAYIAAERFGYVLEPIDD